MNSVTRRGLLGWIGFASSASLCTRVPSTLREEIKDPDPNDWRQWVDEDGFLDRTLDASIEVRGPYEFALHPGRIECVFNFAMPMESPNVGAAIEAFYNAEPLRCDLKREGMKFSALVRGMVSETYQRGDASIPAYRFQAICFDIEPTK